MRFLSFLLSFSFLLCLVSGRLTVHKLETGFQPGLQQIELPIASDALSSPLDCTPTELRLRFVSSGAASAALRSSIPVGSLVTLILDEQKVAPNCLFPGQPAKDGKHSIARVLTGELSLSSVASNSVSISARFPGLNDVFQSGSVLFTQDSMEDLFDGPEDLDDSANAMISSAISSSSAPLVDLLSQPIEPLIDIHDPPAESDSEGEVNAAFQTRPFGFNINAAGNGAKNRVLALEPWFKEPAIKFNCTDCYFGVSFGVQVAVDWDTRKASETSLQVSLFADLNYNFQFGLSFNLYNAKLKASKELKKSVIGEALLAKINIFSNKVLAMLGPVPLVASAEFTMSASSSLNMPITVDSVIGFGGGGRFTAGLVKNGQNKGGKALPPAFKSGPRRSLIAPGAITGSLGVSMGISMKFMGTMKVSATTGPQIALSFANAACQPPPVILTAYAARNIARNGALLALAAPLNAGNAVQAALRNPRSYAATKTANVDLKWTFGFTIVPIEITIVSFKWQPWTIEPIKIPSINIARLLSVCLPISPLENFILTRARIKLGSEAELNEAELDDAMPNAIAPRAPRGKSIHVDVQVSL